MNQKRKKILVTIDGSDQSLNVARYISKIQLFQKPEVVLFHVLRKIDQTFWDMGVKPVSRGRIAEISAWEVARKKQAQEFMNQAFDILVQSGFTRESVKVDIHKSQVGIARDIAKESLNRYDAIAVGRKGLSKLKNMVLGSVAIKLVEKLSHVPVCVVGGNPGHGKILLSMDASEGAMKAVDYTGKMIDGSNANIMLFHAVRTLKTSPYLFPKAVDADYEEKMVKEINTEMNKTFAAAKERLVNVGLNAANIKTKFNAGVSSRAGAIIAEAAMGEFGTIVMGRRGLSKVEDFFIGRVSNKVLHLAKNQAVWIVN